MNENSQKLKKNLEDERIKLKEDFEKQKKETESLKAGNFIFFLAIKSPELCFSNYYWVLPEKNYLSKILFLVKYSKDSFLFYLWKVVFLRFQTYLLIIVMVSLGFIYSEPLHQPDSPKRNFSGPRKWWFFEWFLLKSNFASDRGLHSANLVFCVYLN